MKKKKLILNFTGKPATKEQRKVGVIDPSPPLMLKIHRLLYKWLTPPTIEKIKKRAVELVDLVDEFLEDLDTRDIAHVYVLDAVTESGEEIQEAESDFEVIGVLLEGPPWMLSTLERYFEPEGVYYWVQGHLLKMPQPRRPKNELPGWEYLSDR